MTNRAKHIIQYAETVETFTATQYVTTLNADVSLHSIVNILMVSVLPEHLGGTDVYLMTTTRR